MRPKPPLQQTEFRTMDREARFHCVSRLITPSRMVFPFRRVPLRMALANQGFEMFCHQQTKIQQCDTPHETGKQKTRSGPPCLRRQSRPLSRAPVSTMLSAGFQERVAPRVTREFGEARRRLARFQGRGAHKTPATPGVGGAPPPEPLRVKWLSMFRTKRHMYSQNQDVKIERTAELGGGSGGGPAYRGVRLCPQKLPFSPESSGITAITISSLEIMSKIV